MREQTSAVLFHQEVTALTPLKANSARTNAHRDFSALPTELHIRQARYDRTRTCDLFISVEV